MAKKFVTKSIKLDPTINLSSFSIKLTQQLRQMYSQDSLNLIGGFQDNANNLHLLMFKLDKQPTAPIKIFAETFSPTDNNVETQRQEIETLINKAHLDNQGILRCSISVGPVNQRSHVFVFEEMDGDRLYLIMKFQPQLQSKLLLQKQAGAGQTQVNFDEMLTKLINSQEHRVSRTNVLTSLVVNQDFESSFVVTAT